MVLRSAGPFDLYREQVQSKPGTYTGTERSDDFYTAGVHPYSPAEPQRTYSAPYASQSPPQQTVDSWNAQIRQLHIQT